MQHAAGIADEVVHEPQPEVALAALRVGGEAVPVVGDGDPRGQAIGADRDLDASCARVRAHVAQRLLGDPEEQRLGVLGEVERRRDVDRHGEAVGDQRGGEVVDRAGQALLAQRGRVDVDQQRAQLADGVAGLLGAGAQRGRGCSGGLQISLRAEVEGEAGEPLQRAVVQVGGDAPALELGGGDRAAQQGDAVRGVQEEFQFRNLSGDPNQGLQVDGIFGPQTDTAVRGFQQALHQDIPSVTVDGIVGPITWQALVSGMLSF